MTSRRFWLPAGTFLLAILAAAVFIHSQSPNPPAERLTTPGPGPFGVPQIMFSVHRLGTDHAEGVTTLDMNGDGYPDILSGAYWYQNPGQREGHGFWSRHRG